MSQRDYYEILGIDKKASKDDIKKAYRKLAHKYHPDKKGGDEEKFKEASEAYSVLSDDKKRQEYDTYGQTFGSAGPGGAGAGFGGFDFSGFSQDFDLGDIFGDFFNGGRSRTPRGRDISIDIELDFKDAIFGITRNILVTKNSTCKACTGSGAEKGSAMKTCGTCTGHGVINDTKRTIFGTFNHQTKCTTCFGSGKVPEKQCKECKGIGVKNAQEEIKVKVPAGVEDGQMVRLTGLGEAIPHGRSGDLYVKIHVKKDPRFRKENADIHTDLPVKLTDALLGSKYSVETLDGKIDVKIPAGVSHNELLRVKGKGVPVGGSSRGDLMIRIQITMPQKLSRKAKKLLEELKGEGI